MLISEAEAKEKWCPMGVGRASYFTAEVDGPSPYAARHAVRHVAPPSTARCVGRSCMWWEPEYETPHKRISETDEEYQTRLDASRGRCGAVGARAL